MTTEIKIMIIVGVASVAILFGGAWLYQATVPSAQSDVLTQHQEALVRDDSVKAVAPHQKAVVVEFGDYQCPACAAIAPQVRQLMDAHKDDVTFVFRNFPLTQIHKNAMISAQMTRIAGEQGKNSEMGDYLFAHQSEWETLVDPTDTFISYASALGMATSSIKQELSSGKYIDKINADEKDGELVGVNSTPTFFVGNSIIRSADYNALKKAVDAAVASAT
jgi:protein-disulfide isomerase